MYPLLMGTFNFLAPLSYIHVTLVGYQKMNPLVPIIRVGSCRTMYFEDPWVLISLCESIEGLSHDGMAMPFSATKIAYQAI